MPCSELENNIYCTSYSVSILSLCPALCRNSLPCPARQVGGLADVVTGLCRALQRRGHLVEIVLPKYDCMDYSRIQGLKVRAGGGAGARGVPVLQGP